MKKKIFIILAVIFIICFTTSIFIINNTRKDKPGSSQALNLNTKYMDGVYEDQSMLTSEGYFGKAKLTIKDGRITDIDFNIYDTSVFKAMGELKDLDKKERILDKSYGDEVYKDNPVYRQQTMNELNGIEKYKNQLLKVQNPDKVDLISGATWSMGIFKDTVGKVLDKAESK